MGWSSTYSFLECILWNYFAFFKPVYYFALTKGLPKGYVIFCTVFLFSGIYSNIFTYPLIIPVHFGLLLLLYHFNHHIFCWKLFIQTHIPIKTTYQRILSICPPIFVCCCLIRIGWLRYWYDNRFLVKAFFRYLISKLDDRQELIFDYW